MLFAKNTPNNTGVAVYGDYIDFDYLYKSLHKVVSKEDADDPYFPASTRVLSVCYDIRHALMGNGSYKFVDNGLNSEKKRRLSLVAPNKNMYYEIKILWPEAMFVMLALNDLLGIYANKITGLKYSRNLYGEVKFSWDKATTTVRSFQAAIYECLQKTIPQGVFTRLINLMDSDNVNTSNYLTQYIDHLNDRFLKMNNDNKLRNISRFAKRIAEQPNEYQELRKQFLAEAKKKKRRVIELALAVEYPEEIEW